MATADSSGETDQIPHTAARPASGTFIKKTHCSPQASPATDFSEDGSNPAPAPGCMEAETAVDGTYRGRMDFVMENVRADDATHMVYTVLKPDPRRYTTTERDGVSYYLDKYLRVIMSHDDMMESLVKQMRGLPIYQLSPAIETTADYAAERREAIANELENGKYIGPSQKLAAHRDFATNPQPRAIAFLSIDICGASALRKANRDAFDAAYKIFLRELGTLVAQFNGTLLKPTGDGFIALIDYPAFTVQCDNAVDLGLSLIYMLSSTVNPLLAGASLPELNIRVGADFGLAELRSIEIPATGYITEEVASDALNRAVKIQESCCTSEFRIGRSIYELVHVKWLERCREVQFDPAQFGLPRYRVYRVV